MAYDAAIIALISVRQAPIESTIDALSSALAIDADRVRAWMTVAPRRPSVGSLVLRLDGQHH